MWQIQIKPVQAVQLNNCDSITSWSGATGVTVSLDTSVKFEGSGSVKVERVSAWTLYAIYDPTGTWNWSATTDISFRLLGSNAVDVDFEIYTDWSNWRKIDLGNAPTSWRKITALFSSVTGGAGTLNLASVSFIRFAYNVANNSYTLNIDDIQVDSTYIYAWNFNDGSRGSLAWDGEGAIDNGTGWCSMQTDAVAGSSKVTYDFSDVGTLNVSVTMKLVTLPTINYVMNSILRLTSQSIGAGSTHLFYVSVQKNPVGIYYRTYLLGAASTSNASSLVAGDVIYMQCYVTMGSSATALTYVNGTLAGNATGGSVSLAYNRVSAGFCWAGEASQNMTLYDVSIYGQVASSVTIAGQVTVGGIGLENVRVWAGLTSTETNSTGNYSLTVYAGSNVVSASYNGSYRISSIEVDASSSVTGQDLALVPYTNRIDFFTVKSMTVFPYWFAYNTTTMDTCLSDMNTVFNDSVNCIDIRTYFKEDPLNDNNVTYTYGQSELENGLTVLANATAKAHNDGKNVTLGIISGYQLNSALFTKIAPSNYAEWWVNYGEYLKWIGAWAEGEGIERIIYGWEFGISISSTFEDGTFTAEHSAAIAALRTTFSGEVGYEFNWIESTSELADLLSNTFIGDLDFVAISHYHPLSLSNYDTIDNMINAWFANPFNSINYTDVLTQLYSTYSAPILINIGYPNQLGGITHPWTWGGSGTTDYDTKAMAFEAMFRALENVTGIMGVDLEHYDQISTGSGTGGQTFRNESWVESRILLGLLAGTESGIVTVTVTNPQSTTYTTPTIPIEISASGGTIDHIWWNCTYLDGTPVYPNTTYISSTSITLGNGNYVFYANANNTVGEWDVDVVYFSVSILATVDVSLITPTNGVTSTSFTVSFVYTPTVRGDLFYSSQLWLNLSGIWQVAAYNSSIIANYTTNSITYVFPANNTYLWNIKIWNSTTGVFASSNRILTIAVYVAEINRYQLTVIDKDLALNTVDAYCTQQFLNGSVLLDYMEGEYSLLAGTITVKTYYLNLLLNSTDFSMVTYGNSTVTIYLNMRALATGGYLAVNKTATISILNQTSILINATITASGGFTVMCAAPFNASLVQLDGVNVTDWLFNATNLSLRANLTSGDFSMTFAETLGEPWFGVTVGLVSLGSLGGAIWYYRRAARKKSKVVPAS